jgi:hypothetical protein
MKKPNLPKLKTSAETDLQKDTEKIGKCMHAETSEFYTNKDNPSPDLKLDCDFNPDATGKKHKVFDNYIDVGFVCDNCHAVICK